MQILFLSGTLGIKTGLRCCHLGCLTGRGLVQEVRWGLGGGVKTIIFLYLPIPTSPFFPLNASSLGKYFLAPILQLPNPRWHSRVLHCRPVLCKNWYSCTSKGRKKNSSHVHKTGSWYLLGVLLRQAPPFL